jgi:hypothetical protein
MESEATVTVQPHENENAFQKKQKKGTIDIWWLYDDGGNSAQNIPPIIKL